MLRVRLWSGPILLLKYVKNNRRGVDGVGHLRNTLLKVLFELKSKYLKFRHIEISKKK